MWPKEFHNSLHYYIVARRLDDDLVVEYEGESHEDYPGGNDGYTFSWEDGYVKGLIKKYVNENLDKEKTQMACIKRNKYVTSNSFKSRSYSKKWTEKETK